MKKIIYLFFIGFLFSQDVNFTVLATTNVNGEIDPCGWKKKPLGGLARKATIIDQINEEHLVIDGGDLFFKKEILEPGITLETAKINAEVILESFNKMGCHAFSPGSKDFAAGKKFVMSLKKKSKFPFISSNIRDKNGNHLFDKYIIEEINDLKIGIIGLASKFDSDGIIVADPIESLESIIYKVKEESDIVFLLFNADEQDLKRLYKRNFPIDFILRSKSRTRSSDGGSKIPTYIAGDRGKLVYQFTFEYVDQNVPFVDIAWCNETIKRMEDRLNKMKQGNNDVDLHDMYKNDQATLNRIKNYESQLKKANTLYENAINKIQFKKIELGRSVPDKPNILKIVDRGKIKIKDLIGPVPISPIGPVIGP